MRHNALYPPAAMVIPAAPESPPAARQTAKAGRSPFNFRRPEGAKHHFRKYENAAPPHSTGAHPSLNSTT